MSDDLPQLQLVPVDHLHFDPQNPRLPSTLNPRSEPEILEWMLDDGTIIEIMNSIGEQGYFAGEPLLAIPAEEAGHYEVVEGNRRLTATKLLLDPSLAPVKRRAVQAASDAATHKPKALPVVKYRQREEILAYLGFRHITGIKSWSPLAKAKYLRELLPTLSGTTELEKYRAAAREIGSRTDYVERLLTGLALYDEIAVEHNFFKIPKLDEQSLSFSLITTALGYTTMSDFLGLQRDSGPKLEGLSTESLHELTSWMFEQNDQNQTRLGESRNLRQLSAIVANPDALKGFRTHLTLDEAYRLTSGPAGAFSSSLVAARTSLQSARDSAYLVETPGQPDVEVLMQIQRLAGDLRAIVTQRLKSTTDSDGS